jgi:hypothetical protein
MLPHTPSLVRFVTPAALTPGQWTVKAAARFLSGGSKFAAEVREGVAGYIYIPAGDLGRSRRGMFKVPARDLSISQCGT